MIVPTYNEAANIAEVIARVRRALRDWPHEVIVVDDDSPDGTWQVATRVAADTPGVTVLRRFGERGLASAVLDGMAVSGGEALAVIDADLQHDESVLAEMVSCVLDGRADMCVGTRNSRGGSPGERTLPRRWATAAGAATARLILPELRSVTDPLSGYFVVSRSHYERAVAAFDDCLRGYKILWLFLARCPGLRIAEVGHRFRPRVAGRTKLSPGVMLDDLAVALSLRLGPALPPRRARAWLVAAGSILGGSVGVVALAACRRRVCGRHLQYCGLRAMTRPQQLRIPAGGRCDGG